MARVLAPLADMGGHIATSVRQLGLESTKDVDLFQMLANPDAKAVLITADKAMSRRQHEIAAIRETGAVVVLCTKVWNQQSDVVERTRMMVWWWPMILHCSMAADRGSFLEVPWANTVKALRRWRA